jgi:hypothetical protein
MGCGGGSSGVTAAAPKWAPEVGCREDLSSLWDLLRLHSVVPAWLDLEDGAALLWEAVYL